jgi:hypothetical protein
MLCTFQTGRATAAIYFLVAQPLHLFVNCVLEPRKLGSYGVNLASIAYIAFRTRLVDNNWLCVFFECNCPAELAPQYLEQGTKRRERSCSDSETLFYARPQGNIESRV